MGWAFGTKNPMWNMAYDCDRQKLKQKETTREIVVEREEEETNNLRNKNEWK